MGLSLCFWFSHIHENRDVSGPLCMWTATHSKLWREKTLGKNTFHAISFEPGADDVFRFLQRLERGVHYLMRVWVCSSETEMKRNGVGWVVDVMFPFFRFFSSHFVLRVLFFCCFSNLFKPIVMSVENYQRIIRFFLTCFSHRCCCFFDVTSSRAAHTKGKVFLVASHAFNRTLILLNHK